MIKAVPETEGGAMGCGCWGQGVAPIDSKEKIKLRACHTENRAESRCVTALNFKSVTIKEAKGREHGGIFLALESGRTSKTRTEKCMHTHTS